MLRLSEYSILRAMRGADKLMKLREGTIWEDAEGGGKLTRCVAKIPQELKCLEKKKRKKVVIHLAKAEYLKNCSHILVMCLYRAASCNLYVDRFV